ncbi:MAG: spermidine/putrescine transport system ATP-binding protein [Gaiellales bacterium]|jgi:spermidine/putrescine transport system ATP-binding protein|nr:spermidine/putrescine transport system ATP-binding protein [Gaiellales bacterium]
MQGEIRLESLVKSFGDVNAVDGIDLEMPPGEFFTMVGPSGCGKTTTLRMIAGFERPTSGRILLDGEDVAQTPPHRRNVNTVFQSYALFPHLNVADNVAFGLKYKKVTKGERAKMVDEALALVQLTGYEKRKPGQLSGGQQQRIALARALVLRPRVLLLDEPLGALDARLRKDLQVELKTLQESLGITFVFVTHDQEEALTMSDRVAVMNGGRVEQSGPPQEIYEEPATLFVADFLGVSNLVGAEAAGQDGRACVLRVGDVPMRAEQGDLTARGAVKAMIRPERVRVEPHGTPGENRLPGLVEHLVFLGSFREVRVRLLGGALVTAIQPNDGSEPPYEQGTPVSVHLPVESLRVLPEESAPVAGEMPAGGGTEAGADLGRAAATVLLPPQDPPPAS